MTDDVHYTDIDVPEVIEETEQYIDSENQVGEVEETDLEDTETHHNSTIQNSEILNSEEPIPAEKKIQSGRSDIIRSTRLPVARIKNIMKMDPDVHMVNSEAVFLVTKATEMFLETIAKETYAYMSTTRKKTVTKKDLDATINMVDCLCFLEGALD